MSNTEEKMRAIFETAQKMKRGEIKAACKEKPPFYGSTEQPIRLKPGMKSGMPRPNKHAIVYDSIDDFAQKLGSK